MNLHSNENEFFEGSAQLLGLSDEMQVCVENCNHCHQVCLETIEYCLRQGEEHAEPAHIRLLQDCAEICTVSQDFMLRNSHFHSQTCALCSEICFSCAEDCERFSETQGPMSVCAELCRICAESCQQMANVH